MKLKSNEVVICRDNYGSDEEMFNAIGDIIKHLTRNEEECFVYADDVGCGIYTIQHTHDNRYDDYGDVRFMLVKTVKKFASKVSELQ